MNIVRLIMLDDLVADHLIFDVKPHCKEMLLHDTFFHQEDGSYTCNRKGMEVSAEFKRQIEDLFVRGRIYVNEEDTRRYYGFGM